jgi:hypothetical protein
MSYPEVAGMAAPGPRLVVPEGARDVTAEAAGETILVIGAVKPPAH